MPKYALLLNHPPERYRDLSEDDMMAIIKDYVAWVEDMSAKGCYHGGQKLADKAGLTLSKNNDDFELHDSPYTELAEVLGGFMLIEADNLDAAIELCKSHPHFVHNTAMEIRLIDSED